MANSIVSKYLFFTQIAAKEILHYPQVLFQTLIIVPFRVGILLLIYNYAFSYIGKPINNINANIAIWSLAIYHILLFMQFRGITKTISEDIRLGVFETHLCKPYDYLVYRFFDHLGKGLPSLFISLVTVIPMLITLVGWPGHIGISDILGLTFLIIGGTFISAGIYILAVLPAFWIDDAQPFFWIVDKAILILGGAYVPVALLPDWLQSFALVSPLGAPMFATQLFYPDFLSKLPFLIISQTIWLIIFGGLINVIFNQARKNISVNGG